MRLCVLVAIYLIQYLEPAVEAQDQTGMGGPPGRLQETRCAFPANMPSNVRLRLRSKGRTARFLCDPGYILVGRRFATCLRGHWSNSPPICIKAGCKLRSAPANGRLSVNYGGGLLVYGCNPGYRLEGSTISSCDGALWNSSEPSCKALSNPSLSCNFEDPYLCGWSHDVSHNFEWKRNRFGTPSGHAGTGPTEDHTLGPKNPGYYMYLEASSPRTEGDVARLYSPVYGAEVSEACFRFWYHMFGSTTGSIRVYLKREYQVLAELSPSWSLSGDQGNEWRQGTLNVPKINTVFQLVFEGVRGTDYMGDSAIDDVELVPGPCEPSTTDISGNYSLTSSEEDEPSGVSEVSTSTMEIPLISTSTTSENGTEFTILLEREDEATADNATGIISTEMFTESNTFQNTTSDTENTFPPSNDSELVTSGEDKMTVVTEATSNFTQSHICVVDSSNISTNNESSMDTDWLISISNCSTTTSDSQLTTLPLEVQSVPGTELSTTSTPEIATNNVIPNTEMQQIVTPITSTLNSILQSSITPSTGRYDSTTQFVTNPTPTTAITKTSEKPSPYTKLPILFTDITTNSNTYTTPDIIAVPIPTTIFRKRTTTITKTSEKPSAFTKLPIPFTDIITNSNTYTTSVVNAVPIPTIMFRKRTTSQPPTFTSIRIPVYPTYVTNSKTPRRTTIQPSPTPSIIPVSIPTIIWRRTTQKVTPRPLGKVTKYVTSSMNTVIPRWNTSPIEQPVTRYPWTLRNTSRRAWDTKTLPWRPSTPMIYRTTLRPSIQVTTKRFSPPRPVFRSSQRPYQETTNPFKFSTTTIISMKTFSTPKSPTQKFKLTTRSNNDNVEDSSEEDYNQNDDTEMDLTNAPSVFMFQEFPSPPQSFRVKTQSGPNIAVLATCSVLAVLLTISAASVTFYFLSGRRRRPKQRSLSDDSEMRFLPQSEEVEITLADRPEAPSFKSN